MNAQVRFKRSSLAIRLLRAGAPSPTFSTASVKSGKARGEHIPSGLPPRADIVDTLWHFRFVPKAVVSSWSAVLLRQKNVKPQRYLPCGWLMLVSAAGIIIT